MKYFNKLCDTVNKIYLYLGVAMLIIICVACAVQVFTRYVIGSAAVGTEEISRYCFIWLGFLGSAVCVQNWSNAHISVLNDLLKGKVKSIHSIFLNIAVIVCGGVLFVQGMNCVSITANQLSSMLRIPMCYVYAAIPVGSFGMMLSAARRLLNEIYTMKGGKDL
ncbi:MAG: TRAP transporter small permease [Eubacteriales bacterium]|nr:TRAP transporter small permease [Eubacteriales bacterium]